MPVELRSEVGRIFGARQGYYTNTIMGAPPTVSADATTSAITGGRSWLSVTSAGVRHGTFSYRCGGNLQRYGASYPNNLFVAHKNLSEISGQIISPMTIDFLFDGVEFEVILKGMPSLFRVRVDGEFVSDGAYSPVNDGAIRYKKFQFPSRKLRRITIDAHGMAFGGIVADPTATVQPFSHTGPRCIVMGDSITEGAAATGLSASGWVRSFGESMAWPDTWPSGSGGTGYLAPGAGRYKFRDRVAADLIAFNPDVWVIAGGINDYINYTAEEVGAEAALLYSQIKQALPSSVGIVLSPFWRGGVETMPYTILAVRDAIRSAADSAGLQFVDLIEMPFDGAPITSTVHAFVASAANAFYSTSILPAGGNIEIGSGANRERCSITAVSGAGPYLVTITRGLQKAHSAGEPITEVGPSLWTGTGRVGATAGDGNSDVYISADGTHPTQSGHDAIGETVASLLKPML